MKPSNSVSERLLGLAFVGVLGAYALWVIYPMVWVAFSSLKTETQIAADPFALPQPGSMQWVNFRVAWNEARFGDYFLNSLVVTSCSVALIVLLGAMAAYVLGRFQNARSARLQVLFLAGLMIPVQLSMVPLFFELRALGLLNTRTGLILVYTANGLPFAIFILTGFFRALPTSLYEAAMLDGCTQAQAFWRIMFPLARPGLLTVAIFQFIGIWKEYFFAFMFVSGSVDGAERTLPIGLANLAIVSQYQGRDGPLFAGIVVVTIPILLIYLFLQKYLIRGVAAGALKG